MHHGDDLRRGQKRASETTVRDEQRADTESDGVELDRAQPPSIPVVDIPVLDIPPQPGFQAEGFPHLSSDFSTKSFLSGEFKALTFEPSKANFQSKKCESAPTCLDVTSTPNTSYGKRAKQLPTQTVTPCTEHNLTQDELFLSTEQCPQVTAVEPALSQAVLPELQDTHDMLSTLFPSFKEFLSKGFSGMGDEGGQFVQCHTENYVQDQDFITKHAHFIQPEDSADDIPNEPIDSATTGSDRIYPGSRLSVHESIMSILTFAQAQKLTGVGLGQLLALIDIHCPAENNLVKRTDKLFEHLDYLKSPFELSYYCNICWRARVSAEDLCDQCKNPKRKVHFFVHFSLADQLQKLYERPDFVEALKYRQTRSKINENGIEDIIDGEVYQDALKGFLSDVNNLSMMWYTDGIQLFESTSFSIWPQFFVLLELPPDQRFKPENMLLAGLWGSQDHPHPNIVLRHIVNDLLNLREKGVEVQLPNSEKKVVKVCCLCGTCDSPAKSAFMNLKGHAGYYACPVCFTQGKNSEATGGVTVFPYEEEVEFRSIHEGYSVQVENSLKVFKSQKHKDEVCRGVQGPTLLSLMFSVCMFKSMAVDSMHCIYGLVKQLLHLYFDSKYSKEDFSLYEKLAEVNALLSNIQLPQFVQRLPLGVDKLSFWKASLCFNFFFHLMLPVLKSVMSQNYFDHLLLFVDSIALLNSSSVSPADIQKADLMLCEFVKDFSKLYKVRHMSLNLHLTRHLATTVKNLGPLWALSCFPFEDFNGKIINLAHGTTDSLIQISRRFPILTGLSREIAKMSAGPAKEFCERSVQKWKRLHIKESISDESFVVGYFDRTVVYQLELSGILSELFQFLPKFHTFPKVYHKKQLFVASSYKRSGRKSCAVKYITSEGVKYGEILTFVKVENRNYYAYIQSFNVLPFVQTSPEYVSYLNTVGGVTGYDFVLVKNLEEVCFYITIEETCYISTVLNRFERF